jgi:hypothetical protein
MAPKAAADSIGLWELMIGASQTIRFCTSSDGVRIAFTTLGRGPALVKAANWLTHIEFDHASSVWRHWLAELSRGRALTRYDVRGCGLLMSLSRVTTSRKQSPFLKRDACIASRPEWHR